LARDVPHDSWIRRRDLISRTNYGLKIKGPTAAVGDQASGLRLLVAGAGFVHLPATGYRFVEVRELP
jgi:hypothetical protein